MPFDVWSWTYIYFFFSWTIFLNASNLQISEIHSSWIVWTGSTDTMKRSDSEDDSFTYPDISTSHMTATTEWAWAVPVSKYKDCAVLVESHWNLVSNKLNPRQIIFVIVFLRARSYCFFARRSGRIIMKHCKK